MIQLKTTNYDGRIPQMHVGMQPKLHVPNIPTYLSHDTITVQSLLLATSEQELKLQGVLILF